MVSVGDIAALFLLAYLAFALLRLFGKRVDALRSGGSGSYVADVIREVVAVAGILLVSSMLGIDVGRGAQLLGQAINTSIEYGGYNATAASSWSCARAMVGVLLVGLAGFMIVQVPRLLGKIATWEHREWSAIVWETAAILALFIVLYAVFRPDVGAAMNEVRKVLNYTLP